MEKFLVKIEGIKLDHQSRCDHWYDSHDIVALKFPCCQRWFACFDCHKELTDHPSQRWQREQFDEKAIFCGHCQHLLTIDEYLTSNHQCPHCNSGFNPGCQKHYSLYFALDDNHIEHVKN